MKLRFVSLTMLSLTLALSMAAQNVTGSGSPNIIPIWTGTTTLGNSTIFEINGLVGIGNPAPTAALAVVGPNGSQSAPNAPPTLQAIGGLGFQQTTRGTGGIGGGITLTSGSGGRGFSLGSHGGAGGPIQLISGTGGIGANHAQGGDGGMIAIQPGPGGPGIIGGVGGSIALLPGAGGNGQDQGNGGAGGSILLQSGVGGHPQSSGNGGNGGSIILQTSPGGSGAVAGLPGNIIMALAPGSDVGVGNMTPAATLDVVPGGTTLADQWTSRSSRRFKTNIQPLMGALAKIELLQGVTYQRKSDGAHEIGVLAEDVDEVIPEVVSRDPRTNQVQGVDYSRLTALLIEAVKSQQAEIQQLKTQVQQLTSQRAPH